MPIARFQMPDGRIARFEVPEGTSPEQAQSMIEAEAAKMTKPLSAGEKFTTGMADPIHGGAQLLTKMLPEGIVKAGNALNNWLAENTGIVSKLPEGGVDQQVREREQAYQSQRAAAGESGIDWWRMGGNVVSPANVALARAIPIAATLPGKVAAGVAGGAASSAVAPVTSGDFASEKQKQIGIGAVTGGITPVVTSGVARAISPKASVNPDLLMLKEAGVKPTLGQSLGGVAGNLEQKATSIPFIGNAIADKRRQAVEQFNRAAINRTLEPIGQSVDEIGTAGVQKAGDLIGKAYDDALNQIKYVKFDKQFQQDFTQLKSMASGLTPEMEKLFNKKVSSVLGSRVSKINTMLPETFKKAESELGSIASSYSKSALASEKELGDALKQVQALLREQAVRSNPDASSALQAANKAWANLVRIEGASKAAQNAGGIFSPSQLAGAVRAADQSVRKRAVGRGTALMQDLSTAGQNILGNTVPDSGTAGRMIPALGLGYGASIDPVVTGAGLAGGTLLYSNPVQSLLRGAFTSRPQQAQAVAESLRKTSPALIPAGSQIGLGLLQPYAP